MLQFICVQSCIKISCAQLSRSVVPKFSDINKTDLSYLSVYFPWHRAQSGHPVIFVEANSKFNSVARLLKLKIPTKALFYLLKFQGKVEINIGTKT